MHVEVGAEIEPSEQTELSPLGFEVRLDDTGSFAPVFAVAEVAQRPACPDSNAGGRGVLEASPRGIDREVGQRVVLAGNSGNAVAGELADGSLYRLLTRPVE